MIKCMIVDDEPLAREVLESYLGELPEYTITASCKSAIEAKKILEKEKVDVLFLDVDMPGLNGISFYKTLLNRPEVIFTTAYAEFAVEGFELNAVDYLLKPFSFDRFESAIKKLKAYRPTDNSFIMLKADKRIHKINHQEIQYFQSIGDYVKVILKERKSLIISETLKKLEMDLPSSFMRVHKSYIISIPEIDYLEGNFIRIGETDIPVGQSYKNDLKELTGKT